MRFNFYKILSFKKEQKSFDIFSLINSNFLDLKCSSVKAKPLSLQDLQDTSYLGKYLQPMLSTELIFNQFKTFNNLLVTFTSWEEKLDFFVKGYDLEKNNIHWEATMLIRKDIWNLMKEFRFRLAKLNFLKTGATINFGIQFPSIYNTSEQIKIELYSMKPHKNDHKCDDTCFTLDSKKIPEHVRLENSECFHLVQNEEFISDKNKCAYVIYCGKDIKDIIFINEFGGKTDKSDLDWVFFSKNMKLINLYIRKGLNLNKDLYKMPFGFMLDNYFLPPLSIIPNLHHDIETVCADITREINLKASSCYLRFYETKCKKQPGNLGLKSVDLLKKHLPIFDRYLLRSHDSDLSDLFRSLENTLDDVRKLNQDLLVQNKSFKRFKNFKQKEIPIMKLKINKFQKNIRELKKLIVSLENCSENETIKSLNIVISKQDKIINQKTLELKSIQDQISNTSDNINQNQHKSEKLKTKHKGNKERFSKNKEWEKNITIKLEFYQGEKSALNHIKEQLDSLSRKKKKLENELNDQIFGLQQQLLNTDQLKPKKANDDSNNQQLKVVQSLMLTKKNIIAEIQVTSSKIRLKKYEFFKKTPVIRNKLDKLERELIEARTKISIFKKFMHEIEQEQLKLELSRKSMELKKQKLKCEETILKTAIQTSEKRIQQSNKDKDKDKDKEIQKLEIKTSRKIIELQNKISSLEEKGYMLLLKIDLRTIEAEIISERIQDIEKKLSVDKEKLKQTYISFKHSEIDTQLKKERIKQALFLANLDKVAALRHNFLQNVSSFTGYNNQITSVKQNIIPKKLQRLEEAKKAYRLLVENIPVLRLQGPMYIGEPSIRFVVRYMQNNEVLKFTREELFCVMNENIGIKLFLSAENFKSSIIKLKFFSKSTFYFDYFPVRKYRGKCLDAFQENAKYSKRIACAAQFYFPDFKKIKYFNRNFEGLVPTEIFKKCLKVTEDGLLKKVLLLFLLENNLLYATKKAEKDGFKWDLIVEKHLLDYYKFLVDKSFKPISKRKLSIEQLETLFKIVQCILEDFATLLEKSFTKKKF